MSYGPHPWLQTNWDGRAALNFVAGGAGAGLLVAATLAAPPGAALPWLLGAALIALGLVSVWLEIGRPWRALNVFRAPRRSWMTREALVAAALLPAALAVAAGAAGLAPWVGLLALAFLYCQGRILNAAHGIPAWRETLTRPLLIATGLTEGAALWLLWQALVAPAALPGAAAALALAATVRFIVGVGWYRRLAPVLAPQPLAAVNRAGHAFNGGSLAAMALVLVTLASPLSPAWAQALQAAAAALALAGGAVFKWQLITRAAYNQGFALPHLPVRGVRHSTPVAPGGARGGRP